jgi:hypothetical protein
MNHTTLTTKIRRSTPLSAGRAHYDFDLLRHGDAIEVASKPSAREMFRRWKRVNGRRGRLVSSREHPHLLFFLDETPV